MRELFQCVSWKKCILCMICGVVHVLLPTLIDYSSQSWLTFYSVYIMLILLEDEAAWALDF